MEVTAVGWGVTVGLIVALLALDLTLGAVRPHAVGFTEATVWSVFYIGVAVAFGVAVGSISGWDYGTEYFAGYLVEKSLSVDNLFVFVIIMTTFAVPEEHQHKVLTFGILLALDRKSTRLNSSHANISYAVFCLKKKKHYPHQHNATASH